MAPEEAREILRDALNRTGINLTEQIETRRMALEAERQNLRESLARTTGWLQSADKLAISSWNLLAVKVLGAA